MITSADLKNKPNLALCLDPATRKAEGVSTPSEQWDRAMYRDEKELQRQINDYLRLHGLEYINPPMHKRSLLPSGWPDHTTSYLSRAIGIEAKVWGEKPDPHQAKRHEAMRKSGWIVIVAHSVADVQALFRELDAARP